MTQNRETIDIVEIFKLDSDSETIDDQVRVITQMIWKVIGQIDTLTAADFFISAQVPENEATLLPKNFFVNLFVLLAQFPEKSDLIESLTQLQNS